MGREQGGAWQDRTIKNRTRGQGKKGYGRTGQGKKEQDRTGQNS